jgi:hypothetical protein
VEEIAVPGQSCRARRPGERQPARGSDDRTGLGRQRPQMLVRAERERQNERILLRSRAGGIPPDAWKPKTDS